MILARLSSSRLPGKALKKIAGKTVLTYLIERIETVVPRSQIVLATSRLNSDDALEEFAKNEKINCYRGDLENVAQRFFEAAQTLPGKYACRINGDNIFLDPTVLKKMIDVANKGEFDFLSNVKKRTFPKGMSIEIARKTYFETWLPTITQNPAWAEHVMLFLYDRAQQDAHFYLKNEKMPQAAGIQLALDTAEDFERSKWMLEHIDFPHQKINLKNIFEAYKAYEQHIKR